MSATLRAAQFGRAPRETHDMPMRPSTRRLFRVAALVLAVWVIGAVVSIAARWPAQFGGPGDPNNVAAEFLTRGTAFAPPLAPMLALAAFTLLVRSRRWWGTIAAAGLCLLGALFTIGSLGEALAPYTPDVPRAVLLASGIIGGAFSLWLLVCGLLDLRDRARSGRPR